MRSVPFGRETESCDSGATAGLSLLLISKSAMEGSHFGLLRTAMRMGIAIRTAIPTAKITGNLNREFPEPSNSQRVARAVRAGAGRFPPASDLPVALRARGGR